MKLATRAFLILSMAPLVTIVNGAGISGKDESVVWTRYLENLAKEGKAAKLGEGAATDSGLPKGSPVRGAVAKPEGTADGRQRNIQAVFLSTESPRVNQVVLQAMEKNFKKGEGRVETFRLNSAGILERATLFETKMDEAGIPVPGTDRVSQLDLDARKTKKALRRELDFWLRGVGRKK